MFFEGKAADNDIVFNPQLNPSLQLRLWQEKSVSFPYFEDLLLPWEGYLYGIDGDSRSLPGPSEADPLPVRPVAPAPVHYGS